MFKIVQCMKLRFIEIVSAAHKSAGMLHLLNASVDFDGGVPRGEFGGGFKHPPPKFRIFDRVEPGCKLSGKCLVFLFQHPNEF
jgi:hypothetical protein